MNQSSTPATFRTSRFARFRSIFALSSLLGVGYYNWLLYFAGDDWSKRRAAGGGKEKYSHFIRNIPTRYLSRLWGRFTNSHFSSYFITTYSRVFNCNIEESMPSEYSQFRTLNEFFTRNLKPNTRPICHDLPLVSPCDGKVLNFGTISASGCIEQIKGETYSVSSLLKCKIPHSRHKDRFLHYITLYLSPGDYHHFHSPAEWKLLDVTHVPGDLLPVSPWILKWVSNIFSGNERVVLTGDWRWGFFSFVAVGAFNVGNIHISQVPSLRTNTKRMEVTRYPIETDVKMGSEIGQFKLGSTIILLFEAPEDFAFVVAPDTSVRYGEPIGVVQSEVIPLSN